MYPKISKIKTMKNNNFYRKKISIEKLQLLFEIILFNSNQSMYVFYPEQYCQMLNQMQEILKTIEKSYRKNKLQSVKINNSLINFLIQNETIPEKISFLYNFYQPK